MGWKGLNKNEVEVARTRELIGDDVELMLDCWLSLDVEYTVRLAELLRPYRLKWLEDYLIPEDFEGFAEVRRRIPWQTLATGEHWYMPLPFSMAARSAPTWISSNRMCYGRVESHRAFGSVISPRPPEFP